MITICIEEEYGYRYWLARLTDKEYAKLIGRWENITGLNCLVPVDFIIPQATEVDLDTWLDARKKEHISCHIHEHDDSYLALLGTADVDMSTEEFYKNGEPLFCMDGKEYKREDYWPHYKDNN